MLRNKRITYLLTMIHYRPRSKGGGRLARPRPVFKLQCLAIVVTFSMCMYLVEIFYLVGVMLNYFVFLYFYMLNEYSEVYSILCTK